MVHTQSFLHSSDPRSTQQFERISVCPHCNAPTEEKSTTSGNGWEGATYCSDGCGCLEGENKVYMYECQHCKELRDEAECPCEENANQYEPEEDER